MKRRSDNSSSLEMLLDTMCNTFGAVVFLCITLAVVLSMRVEVPEAPASDDEAELQRLRQAFQDASAQVAELVRQRHLSADERAYLQLQREVDARRVDLREARLRHAEHLLAEKKLEKEAAALHGKNREKERLLQEAVQERQTLEKKCAELQKRSEKQQALPEMSFSRRKASQEPPYYFIITASGRLHRLGMEAHGSDRLPASEVDYQRSGNDFVCQAKAGSGRPLMRSADEINPEVWSLIDEVIRQGRRPYFVLAKESAPQFYKLRFALRQRQIAFGWDPLEANGKVVITLVKEAHWEYGE